jgi:hypothetical protein
MKKIIKGRLFDTEKANLVCEIWEGNRGDFRHLDCALYQTPRSKIFFLAGWGGAMTIFSHRCNDGSYCGWDGVIPLNEQDARMYAEKYGSAETVQRFFKVEEA